jgi:hypothetical protein
MEYEHFAALCTFLIEHAHNLKSFDGNNLKSFKQSKHKNHYEALKSYNKNEDININNLIEYLVSFTIKFNDEFIKNNPNYYNETKYYPIINMIELMLNDDFIIKNTKLDDISKSNLKLIKNEIDKTFKDNNVTSFKSLNEIIQFNGFNLVSQDSNENMNLLIDAIKTLAINLSNQNKAQFESLKNEIITQSQTHTKFIDKFKYLYNKIKKENMRVIKYDDQIKRLNTGIESDPLILPKGLSDKYWPKAYYYSDSTYMTEYKVFLKKCQTEYINLSINYLNREIEKIKNEHINLKNSIAQDFNDFSYVKKDFDLKCTNVDEFLAEMKTIAENASKNELIKKDNKLRRQQNKAQNQTDTEIISISSNSDNESISDSQNSNTTNVSYSKRKSRSKQKSINNNNKNNTKNINSASIKSSKSRSNSVTRYKQKDSIMNTNYDKLDLSINRSRSQSILKNASNKSFKDKQNIKSSQNIKQMDQDNNNKTGNNKQKDKTSKHYNKEKFVSYQDDQVFYKRKNKKKKE